MRIKQMLYADSSLGKVQAVFSPKVKHRARVQLTIGQRTRVFPGGRANPWAADHWLSRGTRARGAKPFFSARVPKCQACPKHFHGVEIKLGVERALDVAALRKPWLTREQEIALVSRGIGEAWKTPIWRCASDANRPPRRKMSFNPAPATIQCSSLSVSDVVHSPAVYGQYLCGDPP